MTRPRIAFVASNDTHVRMFAPVAERLRSQGHATTVFSLDAYYGQGAGAAAYAQGMQVVDIERPHGALPSGRFYRRGTIAIWLDVIRAKPAMRSALRAAPTGAVVVGNDRGLLEKLALIEARRAGSRSVLIQDGRLAPRPRSSNIVGWVKRGAKAIASAILRALGLAHLAASDYGEWGVDLICASGSASARLLAVRAGGRSRIMVTGQPRYDALNRFRAARPSRRWDAVMITTPFEHSGLGRKYQDRQLTVAAGLAEWAERHGRRIAIKPHPRENAEAYRSAVGEGYVVSTSSDLLLGEAGMAVIGISTLVEESAIVGCPVVVPGAFIHGDDFDAVLPPKSVYPRCESLSDLVAWIERLRAPAKRVALLESQTAYVDEQVDWRSGVPAAERVATAMLES
jgi:hypothetical protein